MSAVIGLDLTTPRQWQLALLKRLAGASSGPVRVRPRSGGATLPVPLERLFAFEARLHRLPRPGPMSPVDPDEFAAFLEDGTDDQVSLDLSGAAEDGWQLVIDGQRGMGPEAALAAAALARRSPVLAIVDGEQTVAAARPGTEAGGVALAACEDWLARLSTLVVAVLAGARPQIEPLPDDTATEATAVIGNRDTAERAAKAVAAQAVRLLYRLLTRSPHWRIGWRRLDGPDVFELRTIPPGWQVLPDDGLRFYADPFLITHDGSTAMFMEEYPHRSGRGVISAVCFGPDGPIGEPRPVLDTGSHLSYPHVFHRDGALWMIPESCSTNGIDLYRCTAFPGGWQHHARLVDGIVASDATLVEADGLLWLFATVRDGGGAFSDALHLWWAERLDGPWTAHAANPVLIDIAGARPAGAFVRRGGALLRPVQDCRRGYGAALAIARVTRLDRDGFAQTIETQLAPGPNWKGRRLHTLNVGGGLEAIDGSAIMPRLQLGRPRTPRSPGVG